MSRYLITGAYGAIGAWTLRALLDRGHEAIAFVLGEEAPRLAIALGPGQAEKVVRVRGDITDLKLVERVLDEHTYAHRARLILRLLELETRPGAEASMRYRPGSTGRGS